MLVPVPRVLRQDKGVGPREGRKVYEFQPWYPWDTAKNCPVLTDTNGVVEYANALLKHLRQESVPLYGGVLPAYLSEADPGVAKASTASGGVAARHGVGHAGQGGTGGGKLPSSPLSPMNYSVHDLAALSLHSLVVDDGLDMPDPLEAPPLYPSSYPLVSASIAFRMDNWVHLVMLQQQEVHTRQAMEVSLDYFVRVRTMRMDGLLQLQEFLHPVKWMMYALHWCVPAPFRKHGAGGLLPFTLCQRKSEAKH